MGWEGISISSKICEVDSQRDFITKAGEGFRNRRLISTDLIDREAPGSSRSPSDWQVY